MAINLPYYVYVDGGGMASAGVAALIAETLADLGHDTVFPAPGLPEPGSDRVNLVVEPHEFFTAFQRAHSERDLFEAAKASVTLGVEPPASPASELGAHYASVGPMALDISQDRVDALVRCGIDAAHLQLGYHPSLDRWGGDPDRQRPTDLLSIGMMTAHRDHLLSQAAPLLWDWNTRIRLGEGSESAGSRPNNGAGATSAYVDELASSRVLLNVHPDRGGSLEWPRVLAAMANGCLVVTEPSPDYGPLLPGEHLIAAPSAVLGAYAASLMADEVLRSDLAAAAYEFVRTKLEFKTLLEPVCALLEDATTSTSAARFRPPRAVGASPSVSVASQPAQVNALLDRERRMWVRVSELQHEEIDLVQRVEALQAHLRHGSATHVDTSVTQAWAHTTPEVSVVLSSHNDHASVAEAVSSVMTSLGTSVELIVVDDHSEDESVDAVRRLMASTDWFPTKLVARAATAGLGAAWNIGIAEARADRVFISNAKTLIFPMTLQKLSTALDKSPDSAATYGIIAGNGRAGLCNYLPFEAAHLTEHDYLAAVAMIRRPVWEDIAGFRSPVYHWGYEDYEFWLGLADNGYSAEFVPQFVGRLWAESAPRRPVDVERAPLISELRKLYPLLPWGQS